MVSTQIFSIHLTALQGRIFSKTNDQKLFSLPLMGYLERPNLFERQQAEDERQEALRQELRRQRDLELLAAENQRRIDAIQQRLEFIRQEREREQQREQQRRERERQNRNCCRPC